MHPVCTIAYCKFITQQLLPGIRTTNLRNYCSDKDSSTAPCMVFLFILPFPFTITLKPSSYLLCHTKTATCTCDIISNAPAVNPESISGKVISVHYIFYLQCYSGKVQRERPIVLASSYLELFIDTQKFIPTYNSISNSISSYL